MDDNLEKFYNRMMDVRPIQKFKDPTEEEYYHAYLEASAEIAKQVMSSGYYKSFEDLYAEFPLLREVSEKIERDFYEKEESPDIE